MSITKIIGVPYDNIVKISGIPKGSITKIGGVPTPPSVTCTDVFYGYVNDVGSPQDSCISESLPYQFDSTNQKLYDFNSCGSIFAPQGFYSDGISIYRWSNSIVEGQVWSYYGSCSSTPTCDDMMFSYGLTPGSACGGSSSLYSFDSSNQLLYTYGNCNSEFAPEGFYADSRGVVNRWVIIGRDFVWTPLGPCA